MGIIICLAVIMGISTFLSIMICSLNNLNMLISSGEWGHLSSSELSEKSVKVLNWKQYLISFLPIVNTLYVIGTIYSMQKNR